MKLNIVDKAKSYFSSDAAVRIAQNRQMVAQYQTAKSKGNRSTASPKKLIEKAQKPLAQQARHYEENFPIVAAMLDEMTKNVVGDGIKIHPQPKLKNGKPAKELAQQLSNMYEQFSRFGFCMDGRTQRFEAERLMFRALVRDGESFSRKYVAGGHDYLTPIKLGFEPFECDHIDTGSFKDLNIHNGIKLGAYNRTEGFLYKANPADFSQKPVLIPESEMLHLAHKTRINQLRGISKLAPVLGTVSDLANYQEADRLARLAAARVTVVHKVGNSSVIEELTDEGKEPAEFSFEHSNVAQIPANDEIKIIESAKGVGDVVKACVALQKQITTGVGVNHSSTTATYEKSYGAQRQELIDRWAGYQVLRSQLVSYFVRPCYEDFVNSVFIQGMLTLPPDLDFSTLYDAEFTGAVMPWIDPKKEAESLAILMKIGMLPLSIALAQRGLDITKILNQYQQDELLKGELGLDGILAIEKAVTNATLKEGSNAPTNADNEGDD
ncbi:phage portal protein [Vibrio aestuarianus]|uniref:phage portal protein n=1 Tax=Vibrio aestuarianus TaxID=28171 RepID=UPI0015949BBD|nr:phage portal protein [Vibrio aestuarianus]NGZ17983.1 phage portal protein [Vibrio aestuarianus]